MSVPLIDLSEQHAALEAEFKEAFAAVLASNRFVLGEEVEAFEREAATQLGVDHAIGLSSGTDALLVALMAMDIGPGDEVLVPAFTFFATAGSVARTGATPVFCEVCPVCFNLDVADAARRVTGQTKAILPVHLFGQCAEMDGVNELAKEHGLKVIEDAAQAIGARYRDIPSGALGDCACLSFYPTKNLGGFGDGGMLLTNDEALATRVRCLRNHGDTARYEHGLVGGNFRLDALQGALLRRKLPHLPRYTEARARWAARYTEKFAALPGAETARPEGCSCPPEHEAATPPEARMILPFAYAHNTPVWNQYTVRLPRAGERDRLRAFLQERGIGSQVYYPVTMDEQPCFAHLGQGRGLDTAHALAAQVLSLPLFPELGEDRQEEVVAAVAAFLG